MIRTEKDIVESIRAIGVSDFGILTEIHSPATVFITFHKVRWYSFLLKYKIRKLKKLAALDWSDVINFVFDSVPTNGS